MHAHPIDSVACSLTSWTGWRSSSPVSRLFGPRGISSSLLTNLSYPKHVWSPSGGWYAQPANWKANTAVLGLAMFGITALVWKVSAEREVRYKMPEPGRFFPSR